MTNATKKLLAAHTRALAKANEKIAKANGLAASARSRAEHYEKLAASSARALEETTKEVKELRVRKDGLLGVSSHYKKEASGAQMALEKEQRYAARLKESLALAMAEVERLHAIVLQVRQVLADRGEPCIHEDMLVRKVVDLMNHRDLLKEKRAAAEAALEEARRGRAQ